MLPSYEGLCCAIIAGSLISLFVGGRVLYVYQAVLVVPSPEEVDRQRRLAYNRNLPLPWGENFEVRRLWILRLRNPLSQLLLCAVVVQMIQALGLAAVAIAAILRHDDTCEIADGRHGAAVIHQVSRSMCTVTTVVDQFFDFTTLLIVAGFLGLVALPRCSVRSLSSRQPSDGCCRPGPKWPYFFVWFGSLALAGAWSAVEWIIDAHPSDPTSTRYHHSLPWCWDEVPLSSEDVAWSAMRLSGVFALLLLFLVLGVLAWLRLRSVVRQYRRSLKSPSADPRASALASFVKSRAVQQRARHFAVVYSILMAVFVVWRLAPLGDDSSRVALGIICVIHPASGAVTALLWAVCEGVLGEVLRYTGLSCCCVAEDAAASMDEANDPNQVAAVEARLAAPVLEPLPFSHIVLVANAYANRRGEDRWLQGSASDTDADEGPQPLPSEIVTAGTNPVP